MKNKLPFLLNEEKLSKWCFDYCLTIKDDLLIRKYITNSYYAYLYCKCLNNDPEVRKNITYAYNYLLERSKNG